MQLKFAILAVAILLGSSTAQLAGAQAPPIIKYYENGKPIPTPLQVPPVYPTKEFKRRIGGTVIVAFGYNQAGRVLSASVKRSSGNKNLDAAAVASVRQWVVAPLVKDGVPLAGESETPVTFTP